MSKITVSKDSVFDMISFVFEGEIEFKEVRDEIVKYHNGTMTKYTYWDFSNAKIGKGVTTEEIGMLGNLAHKLGKAREGGFDILVAPDALQYGLCMMYRAYNGFLLTSPTAKTMVFRSNESARKWIKDNEISANAKCP
jgi:hypothetical protein